MSRILVFAGSARRDSLNKKLARAASQLARDVGDGKGASSGLAPWRGKVAGLLAASPGGFGGIRALPHLRQVLAALGVTVLGTQVVVPKA